MRMKPLKFIALATLLSACGAVIVSADGGSDPVLETVAEYRQWTRVTGEPLPVPVNLFNRDAAPV